MSKTSGRVNLAAMEKLKRKQRTRSERARIVRAWEASGESAAAFARGQDFSVSSLYAWRQKLVSKARGASGQDGIGFVPLVMEKKKEELESREGGWRIETESGLAISMSGAESVFGLEVALRALNVGRRKR